MSVSGDGGSVALLVWAWCKAALVYILVTKKVLCIGLAAIIDKIGFDGRGKGVNHEFMKDLEADNISKTSVAVVKVNLNVGWKLPRLL